MEAQLLLAEHAVQHHDGTVSMLRGGITHFWTTETPFRVKGTLFVRILSDMAEQGPHKVDLRLMDQDGKFLGPTVEGSFNAPSGGGASTLLLGIEVQLQQAGRYQFNLKVDNVVLGTLTLTAAFKEQGEQQG